MKIGRRWFIGLAFAVGALGAMASVTPSHAAGLPDDTRKIARDGGAPGKLQPDQCLSFAKHVYKDLVQAGGEAYLVVYRWQDPMAPLGQAVAGRHAVVVYRDASGKYYGIDNLTWKPKWLKGSTPSEWAASFAGFGKTVAVGSVITEPSLRGQYASLSRPSRAVKSGPLQALGSQEMIAGR